jgi:diguanylate cyclase (GGDEF)-like protein
VLTQMIVITVASGIALFFLYRLANAVKKLKTQLSLTQAQLTKEVESNDLLTEKLKEFQAKITNNLIDDQLTGLPSRQTFDDRLLQTLSQSQRYSFTFALLVLDLDGFRVFKNVLGMDACNELLKEVSVRLAACIRPMDTVCRLDGSEFGFLIPQLAKPETAAYVAKRLLEAVAQPLMIQKQEVFLTASIGIAVYPDDGDAVATLMQNADQALIQAKTNGNNTYQFYQKAMHSFSQRELSLSSSLHNAESFRDFVIYYQPWVNVRTKKIVCMEAFMHWNHPEHGLIPQQDFLRLAEKSGNMLAIGEWLLRNACQQLQKWQQLGFHPEALALNVSPRQLENPHFTYQVTKVLQSMQLQPANLILQLSEVLLVNKIGMVDKSLRMLKQLGMQVCISHFGAGNIALQNLRGLPANSLKIDKALINDISANVEAEAIVKMIIALANTLKLEVIAEGVENDLQKQRLKELGCEIMLGDMICPPLVVSDFTATVEKRIMQQA